MEELKKSMNAKAAKGANIRKNAAQKQKITEPFDLIEN